MKQQKVYIFDDLFVGVSNCDNEKEALEIIKKQKPSLFFDIIKPLGIEYIRFGWFTFTDYDYVDYHYCRFYRTEKLGKGAIKVFAFRIVSHAF